MLVSITASLRKLIAVIRNSITPILNQIAAHAHKGEWELAAEKMKNVEVDINQLKVGPLGKTLSFKDILGKFADLKGMIDAHNPQAAKATADLGKQVDVEIGFAPKNAFGKDYEEWLKKNPTPYKEKGPEPKKTDETPQSLILDRAETVKKNLKDKQLKANVVGMFLKDLHEVVSYLGSKIQDPNKHSLASDLNAFHNDITSQVKKGEVELKAKDMISFITEAAKLKDDGTLLGMLSKLFTETKTHTPYERKKRCASEILVRLARFLEAANLTEGQLKKMLDKVEEVSKNIKNFEFTPEDQKLLKSIDGQDFSHTKNFKELLKDIKRKIANAGYTGANPKMYFTNEKMEERDTVNIHTVKDFAHAIKEISDLLDLPVPESSMGKGGLTHEQYMEMKERGII